MSLFKTNKKSIESIKQDVEVELLYDALFDIELENFGKYLQEDSFRH